MENYGMVNSSLAMREIMSAVAAEKIPLIEQDVVRSADYARDARVKDPLELTSKDAKSIKMEASLETGAAVKAMRQRGGISAQYLDDFKSEVQQYSNQQ